MTCMRAALALVLGGCVVTGDAGALTAGTTDGASSSSSDGASTADTSKLDIAVADLATIECESVEQTTTIGEKPSDIIIVVASAMDEAALFATFQNFAQQIANDKVEDVRVAMLAGYPPDGICIDTPPLGLQQCPANDDNPPFYRHFDEVIEPDTLLQQLLDAYPQWSTALRPNARKHIFVVSSGDATLDPEQFDAAFVDLDPSLLGYVFHAMAPGSDESDCQIVEPGAPWGTATDYAALAAATGGVFENACDYNVGMLFSQLLDRIVEVALACEYDIPPAPDGLIFDREKVNVEYDEQTVGWVETMADCPSVPDGWYYDDAVAPQRILMCPQTCARFEALQAASIEIVFGCTTIPAA